MSILARQLPLLSEELLIEMGLSFLETLADYTKEFGPDSFETKTIAEYITAIEKELDSRA